MLNIVYSPPFLGGYPENTSFYSWRELLCIGLGELDQFSVLVVE